MDNISFINFLALAILACVVGSVVVRLKQTRVALAQFAATTAEFCVNHDRVAKDIVLKLKEVSAATYEDKTSSYGLSKVSEMICELSIRLGELEKRTENTATKDEVSELIDRRFQ